MQNANHPDSPERGFSVFLRLFFLSVFLSRFPTVLLFTAGPSEPELPSGFLASYPRGDVDGMGDDTVDEDFIGSPPHNQTQQCRHVMALTFPNEFSTKVKHASSTCTLCTSAHFRSRVGRFGTWS